MSKTSSLYDQVSRFVGSLAQCNTLGIRPVEATKNELTMLLPYSEKIVGNPDTGVIHGGAITTLMDTTSGSVLICALPEFELCPTLDLRVDYMRSAQPGKPVYAKATCYRIAKDLIFTRCEAFQERPNITIAHCVATFMRIGQDATPAKFRKMVTSGGVL
jgi:uncharacterized protein (TIGR00369 family)